jgi:ribosomal protein S6E (S10)
VRANLRFAPSLIHLLLIPALATCGGGATDNNEPKAVKLAITVQPTTAAVGAVMAPAVQVTVQDASGSTVTGSTANVTLVITAGTGTAGAVLGGTLTKAAVNGVATFSNLTIDLVGVGYTLTATSSGLTSATSAAFNIQAGAATKLAVTVQPSAVASGAAIAPDVQVAVQDALGNTVTTSTAAITLAITGGTGTAGALLGGTLTQAAVNGVATFPNLTIDKVGAGYTLTASAGGLTSVTSAPFSVTVGAAAKLAFTVQPSAASAGAVIAPAVQVTVQDAQGNTVTGSTADVTLAITGGTGTAGAVLGGTLPQAAFTNLTIDLVGSGYTLTATATGLTDATSSAFINAGTPAQLAFTVQPGLTAAGAAITPAVVVAVQDAQGNTIPGSTANVTLAITGGTGTVGAVLGGTLTHAAVNGVATFANLTINLVGAGYTLTATSGGLTNATSVPFNIQAGAPAKLAVTVQPAPVVAGTAISPAVQVTVQDALDNTVLTSTAAITLAISGGTGTAGAVLGGTLTQAAVNGVATFANLTIDKVGTGYTLTATSTGLTNATSGTFTVTVGAAAKVAFTVQPANANPAAVITPAVQVTVQDGQGNTITTSTAGITLAITGGTGTAGAVLGGTLTQAAVAGVASFADLTVDLVGTGYTITAASSGLTSATSAAFAIGATLAIQRFVGDNQTSLVGFATNLRPAVRITNSGVPVANVPVTFAVASGGGSLVGNATINTDANGVAQVAGWVVGAAAGPNSLTATGAGSYATPNPVTFAATGQTKQYNIVVRNIGPAFSAPVQAAFDSAEAYWERIIYGDLSDISVSIASACGLGVALNETIDDVLILAQFDSIDGPGQILGQAGACSIRISNGLTIYGAMQFDTADVAGLISSGSLNAVILHEMGHVLGFSTLTWNTPMGITSPRVCAQSLTTGAPPNVVPQDTHFDCTHSGATNGARTVFDSIGGLNYTGGAKVPLENCAAGVPTSCGPGNYNSHWREASFGNELMTGYLNGGIANPMSVVTIAAFGDQGYLVNYAAAQTYTHVFTAPPAGRATIIDLHDDQFRVPIQIVDDNTGRLMRVVQPPQR